MSTTRPLTMQGDLQKKSSVILSKLSILILLVFVVSVFLCSCSDNLEIHEDNRPRHTIGNADLGYFEVTDDVQTKIEDSYMVMSGEDYEVLLVDLEKNQDIVTSDKIPDLESAIKYPNELEDLGLRFISTVQNSDTYVEKMGVGDSKETYGILVTVEDYEGGIFEKFGVETEGQCSFFVMKNNKVIYADNLVDDSTDIITSYTE